ncbi:oxygen-independent coproporphyrinogen III oxidase [Stackebrandtia nassauensis DSM 44728]|uniref:Heme chaperone HemW n=1 Tax=Stackebrandtia nassauensis (strain DSM 44728 / CIP 108903 / NRRL B-16338 / NBRC 102104 / LLR-40K-21) TaxID=446470 RepID=D3PVW9_STANL|nr:radical SAM family heme chaperone HemW [Stackebrandtia nassauensis]ADD45090.1 oxygen-independent coproporphyrinogen III oxidase [Stackebrandtia nassauensis DSM 44728]
MPSALPDGEAAPDDGALPDSALKSARSHDFGIYVHIPFCASRCGYCDFNTYTAAELGSGVSRESFPRLLEAEIDLAARVLGDVPRPISTIFFGGGTPSLLPASELTGIVAKLESTFGLTPDAEITTEANPESVDPEYFRQLRAGGFTRVSLGMQSTARRVLAVLERGHTPGRALDAAREAREAGFEHVNLDLIYGTPGETAEDFEASLRAAVDTGADHVSAYSLIVEDGTRLAGQVRRGDIPAPSDDEAADRYLAAERVLGEAGFEWYEVSNWARSEAARCRHNLLYWRGGDWWGLGPGAHSHVGGVRWWNVKHPARYGQRLTDGLSPAQGRELLTPPQRHMEDVLLGVRLADGLALCALDADGQRNARKAAAEGLLDPAALAADRVRLTLRGRLLADAVVRDLVP